MAGTFAHMILARTLCQPEELDGIATLTCPMKRALTTQMNYCELGAVSPDMPFLKLRDASAQAWGNVMHYWQTASFVRLALGEVGTFKTGDYATDRRTAWLFGYVAHLVADLTVHPVINCKVGQYQGHESAHRKCELNQDVFIVDQQGYGDLNRVEYLRNGGIKDCTLADIATMWTNALKANTAGEISMGPDIQAPTDLPKPEEWHQHFAAGIDNFAEEGRRYPLITRHILRGKGAFYPSLRKARKSEYVRDLSAPSGGVIDYDALFDMARRNTVTAWTALAAALAGNNPEAFTLEDADLDTGVAVSGKSIFWGNVA